MSRRSHGEGTIRLRSDGRYEGRFHTTSGQRKSIFGKTKAEVRRRLTSEIGRRDQGLPVADDVTRVRDWLAEWLEDVVTPARRPRTVEGYELIIRRHINPKIGSVRLKQLTPRHVRTLIKELKDEGFAPRTIRNVHACLRSALKAAYDDERVSRNVASMVKVPSVEQEDVTAFDERQAQHFLDAIDGHSLENLFTVILALGLRRGEALALRWKDVDFEERSLRIRHSLQRVEGKLALGPTKTHRSRRPLPMVSVVENALKSERARQAEMRLAAGSGWVDHGLVFSTGKGTPLEPRNVNRALNGSSPGTKDKTRTTVGILRRARTLARDEGREIDLPDITIHGLRHSCVTLLRAKGVPDKVIAEIAGHSRVSTTSDIYGRVVDSLVVDALETHGESLQKK